MYISTQSFQPFFPARPSFFCAESPRNFTTPGPLESFSPSGYAGMYLMLDTLAGLFDSWQQDQGMPFQPGASLPAQPTFGMPGRPGFGPHQCFLGLEPEEPATVQTGTTATQRPAAKPVARVKKNYGIRPLRQSNSLSCGQTSVAMAVNRVTGKRLKDTDIANNYGYGLLSALNSESKSAGYSWRDGGNFKQSDWGILEKKLNKEKTPVIMGLNGPFSPSGRGHIITLLAVEGDKVKYADPADGTIKTTSRQAIENAPGHPQGKFFFYANKHA